MFPPAPRAYELQLSSGIKIPYIDWLLRTTHCITAVVYKAKTGHVVRACLLSFNGTPCRRQLSELWFKFGLLDKSCSTTKAPSMLQAMDQPHTKMVAIVWVAHRKPSNSGTLIKLRTSQGIRPPPHTLLGKNSAAAITNHMGANVWVSINWFTFTEPASSWLLPADNLHQQTIVMVFMFNTHITLDYGYNIHWSWTCHWRRTTNVLFLRTAAQHVHCFSTTYQARASPDICLCQRPGFLHTWLAKAETDG